MLDHNTLPSLITLNFYLAAPKLKTAVFIYTIHPKIDRLISLHLDFWMAAIDQVTIDFFWLLIQEWTPLLLQ